MITEYAVSFYGATLASCALMLGLPTTALAQDVPIAVAAGDASGEIIVTAQKRSERAKDVPISISSVTGDFVRTSGIVDVRDLRLVTSGLNITVQGPFVQPSLRGVSTSVTGTDSSSIAVYVDGVYQSSKAGNVLTFPDVSRIEIAKGPQGTLFGRNATGGAIQVFTRDPEFKLTGAANARAGIGGHGQRTAGVDAFVTGPLSSNLAMSATGAYTSERGYYVNAFNGHRLGAHEFLGRVKLLYEPSSDVRFIAHVAYTDREDDGAQARQPYRGNTLARAIDPTVFLPSLTDRYTVNDSLAHLVVKNLLTSFKGEFSVPGGELTSLTSYTESNVARADEDGDSSPLVIADYKNPTLARTKIQEFTFASKKFGGFSFIAGANAYFNTQGHRPNLTVNNTFMLKGTVKTEAYAGFAEGTYNLNDRITIIGGVRYSYEKRELKGSVLPAPAVSIAKKHWTDWTPRGSVRYAIDKDTNIYFTYSRGFMSGILNPDALSPIAADPESVAAYEFGVKTSKRAFNLAVAAFYYDYKDLQVQTLLNTGLVTYLNAASAKIGGFEAEGTIRATDAINVRASISWIPESKYADYPNAVVQVPTGLGGNSQTVVDASGFRLIRSPKFSANLGLNYKKEYSVGTLDGNMLGYYSSSYNQQLLGRVRQNAFFTLNAELGWKFADSGVRVAAYGRNLTDYRDLLQNAFDGAGADNVSYAPPREVGLKLGYNF